MYGSLFIAVIKKTKLQTIQQGKWKMAGTSPFLCHFCSTVGNPYAYCVGRWPPR